MIIRIAVLTLAALLASSAYGAAQQVPCVPCAISREQSMQQVNNNQEILRETLQNQLNNQLQGQSSALATQQMLRSLQLNGAMNAGSTELQQLLQEQQIELLQIEQQAIDAQRKAHSPEKAARPKAAPGKTASTKKPSVHPH